MNPLMFCIKDGNIETETISKIPAFVGRRKKSTPLKKINSRTEIILLLIRGEVSQHQMQTELP